MGTKIKLNSHLKVKSTYKIVCNAKYAESILMGFWYRNGIQHIDWDYITEVLAEFDVSATFKRHLESKGNMSEALVEVSKDLEESLKEKLRQSPTDTLNWWIEDYSPADSVEIIS